MNKKQLEAFAAPGDSSADVGIGTTGLTPWSVCRNLSVRRMPKSWYRPAA